MHPRIREVIELCESRRAALREAVDAVRPELRDVRPAAGGWSVAGVLEHLAITEARVAQLLDMKMEPAQAAGLGPETSSEPLPASGTEIVVDRTTRLQAPEQLRPTGLPAADAWAALERSRATLLRTLAKYDGLALGEVLHPHPVAGPLTMYQWVAFIGAHDARHAQQIAEIAAALDVTGSASV